MSKIVYALRSNFKRETQRQVGSLCWDFKMLSWVFEDCHGIASGKVLFRWTAVIPSRVLIQTNGLNHCEWIREIKLMKVLLVVIKLPMQFRQVPAAAPFIAGLPEPALTDPSGWALSSSERAHSKVSLVLSLHWHLPALPVQTSLHATGKKHLQEMISTLIEKFVWSYIKHSWLKV